MPDDCLKLQESLWCGLSLKAADAVDSDIPYVPPQFKVVFLLLGLVS